MFDQVPFRDLESYRYSDFVETITIKNLDWSARGYKMDIRVDWNSDTLIHSISVGSGITTEYLEGSTIVTIRIDSTDIEDFPLNISDPSEVSTLVYDIKTIDENSDEYVILRGNFLVQGGSTR